MKKSLLVLALLAGCGRQSEQPAGNGSAPAGAEGRIAAGSGTARPEASARLTGLYEAAAADRRNQLCMVEEGGTTQFGLVVWGADMHNCSGAGTARRQGDSLRLSMAGDETCEIEAKIEGGRVFLPNSLPRG